MTIQEITENLKSELYDLSNKYKTDIYTLTQKIQTLSEKLLEFADQWIGEWASENHNLYKINRVPILLDRTSIGKTIEKETKLKIKDIRDEAGLIIKDFKQIQQKVITELSIIKGNEKFIHQVSFLDKIEKHEWGLSADEYIQIVRPKQMILTPLEINRGVIDVPPHITVQSWIYSSLLSLKSIETFEKLVIRLIGEIQVNVNITPESLHQSSIDAIPNTLNKFHNVAKQLLNRREDRNTLKIQDEYDVQDLLHALLRMYFDDIRPEEYTPSYAGSSTRVDFLLKREKTVIEVKKTRTGLTDKEVGNQLIQDFHHYKSHPDCEKLICFVYDPDNKIQNPRGLEDDLNKLSNDDFIMEVYIRP